MGLQIRTFTEVFNNLTDWIAARTDKITDFNVGSAARTLSEAISMQFEEFYYAVKQNVLYAIENSIYDSFGFQLQEAEYATGYVTVDFNGVLGSDIDFPAGTMFCTGPAYSYTYYESSQEVVATAGHDTVLIPVRCTTKGASGNIPEMAINTIVTTMPEIRSVYNQTAFTNGRAQETTQDRKRRFQGYIRTLARATRDSIMYGALEVPGVAGVYVDDSYIGYVKLYVHDSNGDLSQELRDRVLTNINSYRAAGIEVEVLPIVKRKVDLSLDIMIEDQYNSDTYHDLLQALVVSKINQYTVGYPLYMADLVHAIMSAYDDVVVNIRINSGKDIKIQSNQIIRAGKVDVRCVHAKDWRE